MNVGVVGLGKMGSAIAQRLHDAGHTVIGFDTLPAAREHAEQYGISTVTAIPALVERVSVIWLMVPIAYTDEVLDEIMVYATSEFMIIDGGNALFSDSVRRAKRCAQKKISFLDCGVSGGLGGRERGFSLMVGGNQSAYKHVEPLFAAVAAPGRYGLVGPSGAGHYVKMVHNGIEYALLQAYAQGFDLLKHGQYQELDLAQITHIWSDASVIRSWILDLSHQIFMHDQDFDTVSGKVGATGMGLWTVQEAHRRGISVSLIEQAVALREESQQTGGDYATKIVALLRQQFGGHAIEKLSQ